MPFVLRWTVWERLPFLGLVVAAFPIAGVAPGLALAVMLGSLLGITVVGGVLIPAWMDVVGRAIPIGLRGRFFALWSTLASLGALAGSFLTGQILASLPAPLSFGVCFAVGAGFMALSYLALAATREPAVPAPAARTTLGRYLRRVPELVRRDANLAWFLGARALAVFGAMATAFYAVHALRRHGAGGWHVGLFTALLYAGQIAGNAAFGWLADRAGHRLVIVLGAAAMVGANLLALGAPSLAMYPIAFALVGLHQAAASVSHQNVLLEFAPVEDERPTYIGLGNTALAPFAFGAPLVAGALADARGYETVFALAGVAGLAAVGLLLVRVRDPRTALQGTGNPLQSP
jgi:MFS family permease